MAESEPVLKMKGRRKSIPGAGSIKYKGPAVEPGRPEGPKGASMTRVEETLGQKYFVLIRVVGQLMEPAPSIGGFEQIATGKKGFKPVSGYPVLCKVLKLPMVFVEQKHEGLSYEESRAGKMVATQACALARVVSCSPS